MISKVKKFLSNEEVKKEIKIIAIKVGKEVIKVVVERVSNLLEKKVKS